MSVFDQSNQTVTHQYNFNVSGNVNFGAIHEKGALIEELKKLKSEFDYTISQNSLEDEKTVEANLALQDAILQSEKSAPDKTTILSHITKAKNLVTGISGLADVLGQAYDKVQLLF